MKITSVRARPLRVPVDYPLVGTTSVSVVLLEIDTDAGVSGHAAASYPMASGLCAVANDDVDALLQGVDPFRTDLVRSMLMTGVTNRVVGGVWSNVASLVDVALWDIKGRALGEPVWRLLGGMSDVVDTYVTFGLPRYCEKQLVQVATQLVDEGHRRLKLVVGASSDPQRELFGTPTNADIRRDAQRVGAVRRAVGDDVELMVDANKNPTLPQAADLAARIAEHAISWFEDPVAMNDLELLRELRTVSAVPLAAGSLGTGDIRAFRQILAAGAADIVQPNVRDIGGFTGGLKAAALAEAFDVPMAMGGNWPHLNMHLYAGTTQGSLVEFHLQGWGVASALYREVPEPVGNRLLLPDRPGLGLDLDRTAIEQFAL